jgi:hypothetical protein
VIITGSAYLGQGTGTVSNHLLLCRPLASQQATPVESLPDPQKAFQSHNSEPLQLTWCPAALQSQSHP